MSPARLRPRTLLRILVLVLALGFVTQVRVARAAPAGAPDVQVDGTTLRWNAVPGAPGYVFVEKVPGEPDRYTDLAGTSVHPAAVPGQMVWFSVRANTADGAWAPEVAIDYRPVASAATVSHVPGVGRLPFAVGLVAGAGLETQLPYLQALRARTARIEFDIDTPASAVARTCRSYARVGIRPLVLASFYGRLPSWAEARRLGTWAAAVGPHGSAWRHHRRLARWAVRDIEFGNETNFGYQFRDDSPAAFAARARTYARRFAAAQTAVRRANRHVGMLAIGDTGEMGTTWIANMFEAVPSLGRRVAGWTVHPYGPDWRRRIAGTIALTARAGASRRIPIWVTEWGLSSDNGRCVTDNYGFNACMTYAAAAGTLQRTLRQMRRRFGSRIAGFYLFQASDQQAPDASSDRESYFGALQADGAPKGAFTAAVRSDLAGWASG